MPVRETASKDWHLGAALRQAEPSDRGEPRKPLRLVTFQSAMVQNPPEGYPRISPYLYYEDGVAAIDWLTRAFGFRERMRMPGEDGRIMHAELELDGGVVMLANPPREGFKNPTALGANTSSVYTYVDDVDAHFERAKDAGAEILQEPETMPYGDRHYGAKDPEGHEWWFGQHVKDVSPEQPEPPTAD